MELCKYCCERKVIGDEVDEFIHDDGGRRCYIYRQLKNRICSEIDDLVSPWRISNQELNDKLTEVWEAKKRSDVAVQALGGKAIRYFKMRHNQRNRKIGNHNRKIPYSSGSWVRERKFSLDHSIEKPYSDIIKKYKLDERYSELLNNEKTESFRLKNVSFVE